MPRSARPVVLWYVLCNFCGIHKSATMTDSMAAGVSDDIWSVRELLKAA